MLLSSPRPTAFIPSTPGQGGGEYTSTPVTKSNRPLPTPNTPRLNENVQSPRLQQSSNESNMIVDARRTDSPKRPSSAKRSVSSGQQIMSPELPPRTGSSASVRSRGSSVSLRRTLSQDESQTMKRSMSRESTTPRKPKHFVVKSKASRVAHRTTSSTSLARTPSNGKGVHQATLLSMTNAKPKETIISTPTSAGNQGRQKALSMTQTDAPSRDLMRKILSDESGKLFYLIVI